MTKPLCSELADIDWLTGTEAGAILAELAVDALPLHRAAARLRARHSAERTHLLLDQVDLRRRAAVKFAHPEQMFFTRIGLEQATDEWVAAYKAARFLQRPAGGVGAPAARPQQVAVRLVDLCCGIGGDLLALAHRGPVVGIDHDPVTAHLAAANSAAEVRATDIAACDLDDFDAWHIDPDRRPGGRRTTSLDGCEPNRATMDDLLGRLPNAAIKLAPATDVPPQWAERCELEWISRERECKQLVAWHGNLAASPGQRRATVVIRPASRGDSDPAVEFRTIVGIANLPTTITTEVAEYVFDIDPAITAARLTGAVAGEHGLCALGGGPTYLTGSRPIDDAALACFRVSDVLPLRLDKLAQHLRAHDIGHLEIKKRGVEIDPAKLRRELKLRGANAAALLVARVGGRPAAILAQRTPT